MVWSYLVVAAAFALILVACLRASDEKSRILASPPMVYLGRISYGLYVFHVFGLKLAKTGFDAWPSRVAVGFVITLCCAMISYHALEKPFLRLKTRFARVASRPE